MNLGLLALEMKNSLLVTLLFAAIWILLTIRKGPFFSNLMTVLVVLFAAYGLLNQAHPLWMVLACTTGLMVWDLVHFQRYLFSVDRINSKNIIIRRHLIHLGAWAGLSLSIVYAALLFELKLNLVLAIALVTILVLALKKNNISCI